jgi:hypothetical protein
MKKVILFISVALACGVLFANVFNSMVISDAAKSDIPNSIMAAREYFKTVNPGDFFKIFSPAAQIFTLLSIILFWNASKSVRSYLIVALLCSISGDTYFHPRSDLMFVSKSIPDNETLKRLSSEWSTMNWVRSFVLFIGVASLFLAVDKIYLSKINSQF